MAQSEGTQNKSYGSNWKKWLLIYGVVAAVAYGVVYFVFMRDSGGSGTGNGNGGSSGYFVFAPLLWAQLRDKLKKR
jgi:preprotein translocase subunit SecG